MNAIPIFTYICWLSNYITLCYIWPLFVLENELIQRDTNISHLKYTIKWYVGKRSQRGQWTFTIKQLGFTPQGHNRSTNLKRIFFRHLCKYFVIWSYFSFILSFSSNTITAYVYESVTLSSSGGYKPLLFNFNNFIRMNKIILLFIYKT